jgi:hypothetical protein
MRPRASRLQGLVVLEGVIMEQARIALELRNPQYVEAFRRAIRQGLDEAISAAQPFLEEQQPWWYELVTGLLSVELAMEEVKTALSLMRNHRAEGREDGRLLDYHRNHWVFQTHAVLEKSIYLIKRVYRTLVKRLDPASFDERMRRTIEPLTKQRNSLADIMRNPMVHPIGGRVTAIEQERLWERYVLIGGTATDVIGGLYNGLPAKRAPWCDWHQQLTLVVLREIDVALAQAAKDATAINAPP